MAIILRSPSFEPGMLKNWSDVGRNWRKRWIRRRARNRKKQMRKVLRARWLKPIRIILWFRWIWKDIFARRWPQELRVLYHLWKEDKTASETKQITSKDWAQMSTTKWWPMILAWSSTKRSLYLSSCNNNKTKILQSWGCTNHQISNSTCQTYMLLRW